MTMAARQPHVPQYCIASFAVICLERCAAECPYKLGTEGMTHR